jgi:hypothetical protein
MYGNFKVLSLREVPKAFGTTWQSRLSFSDLIGESSVFIEILSNFGYGNTKVEMSVQ